MIRIRALNDEVLKSDDDSEGVAVTRKPTREVQEQEALDLYNSTFELIATGKCDEAVSTIEKILDLPLLEEDDSKKCSPVQLQIKLGCLKTLSSIYYSLAPNPEEAVKVLKLTLALDPTNVPLWYRLGQAALQMVNFELAYYAFFQGYESNSNHWGCLENLVTLSYILYDPSTCLEYCAMGMSKDPGFLRGYVFRDHIFRLQPSIKEDALTKWDILTTERKYSPYWENKYLSEIRTLIRRQMEQAENTLKKEQAQGKTPFLCQHRLNTVTFAELCRILVLLYQDAKAARALLRPVILKRDDFTSVSSDETQRCISSDGNSGLSNGLSTTMEIDLTSVTDNDAGESEGTLGGNESGPGGNATDNGEKSGDECQQVENKEAEEEEPKEPNKKKRRDIKWWQIEGKRRSQRVRGNLYSAAAAASRPSKETDLQARFNSILPKILLNTEEAQLEKDPNITSSLTSSSNTVPQSGGSTSLTYFGGNEERSDVESFLAENLGSNTMNLVLALTRRLAKMSDREWPPELAEGFIQVYGLYRNHVPSPHPYSCDCFIQASLVSECGITLTMLEVYRESFQSVEKLKVDETFNTEVFSVSELCRVVEDPTILLRFHWFLANYNFDLGIGDHRLFSTARGYLEDLIEVLTDTMKFSIVTRLDNVISLVTAQSKLGIIQRTENVCRITDLYEAKNYVELIEILPYSAKFEETEAMSVMNRYYLADSYYQVQRYAECHSECLEIMKSAKLPANNQILQKSILLLKRVVQLSDYDISVQRISETVQSLVTLLVDNRMVVPVMLPISPWCILHALLSRLERQDPTTYLEEDTTPASIQILQLAHEQLARTGKCNLNKGKLLIYTLDSLLPLISNEAYAEHENLKHCIEQAIFCLYGHPTKITRFRYLTDHGNPNVKLDLARGRELYDYYKPESLPEFDSYTSISESDASLFLHIVTLIPSETKPDAAFSTLKEFLNGDLDDYWVEPDNKFDRKLYDIFYLLGDHYFKIKEWNKSTEFYTWDLALAPIRFDAWAGIALAKAEKITTLLNSCANFKIMEVMSVANVCAKCFQNALQLNPSNSKLNIEFGSFLYAMHSFCTRLLKQSTDQLSFEHFGLMEKKKDEFLKRAAKCFEPMVKSTNAENSSKGNEQYDEVWINHYMMGKVFQKLDPHSPKAYLDQFEMAAKILSQHDAAYPVKISYYSPQHLAIEALEVYYRIHASILSYIEKHDYDHEMEVILTGFIDRANDGPFMQTKLKRQGSGSETKKKKHEKAFADVKVLLQDMVGRVEVLTEVKETKELPKETPPPQRKSSESSSSHSSSSSSDDDSSGSSTDEDSAPGIQPPTQPTSFRLSVFQEMLRENELRELRLVEAARIAEEKKKTEEENEVEFICEKPAPVPPVPIPEEELHFKDVKYGKIIARCVIAMRECIARFPAHHKSYFRISNTYSTFCKAHLRISRDWLLGTGNMRKKKILGLFGDRKPSNFFNGIWRNPMDDIDRPGSFPYHMSKTVQNLLEVLNLLNDHEMLADIGNQLAKVPDSDKKYLQNIEREEFSKQALTSSVVAARRLLSDAETTTQEVALGIYSSYLKIQKGNTAQKDNGFVPVLMTAYEKHILGKGLTPEPVTFDFVVKYFQHLAWSTKLKSSQKRRQGSTSSKVSATSLKSKDESVVSGGVAGTGSVTEKVITDSFKKLGTKRLSYVDDVGGTTGPRISMPNLIPKPDSQPQLSPANTVVSSISSSSTQGKVSCGIMQGMRKKVSSESSPTVTGDISSKTGREMPNLLSIPVAREDYLRQMGILYSGGQGLPTPAASSSVKSTSSTEEFILPDLSESIAAPWPSGQTRSTSGNHSPASSSSSNTSKQEKLDARAQKYKEITAQALEAKLLFEKVKSMWGGKNTPKTSPNNQSLFTTTATPIDTTLLSKLSTYFMAPVRQNEVISKFQLGPHALSDIFVPAPVPRRTTESLVDIEAIIAAHAKPKTDSAVSVGSVVLEGETIPVFGYSADPGISSVASNVNAAQTDYTGNLGTSSVTQQVTAVQTATHTNSRKRQRSGGRLSGNEKRIKNVARKRTAGVRPSDSIRYRSPPASIPLSTISTFNTSPFKAQSTMVSNPGQFIKGRGQTTAQRRASSPPAAHSANKTPPHASSNTSTEIIDLTTKSPVKGSAQGRNSNGGGGDRIQQRESISREATAPPAKRPIPQMIAIGTAQSTLESQPSHSLPPKKKLAMRTLEKTTSPTTNLVPESDFPEIITLD